MVQIPRSPGIKYVVVLGAGVSADNKIPPNAQLSITALARLVEGIRIHNALPQTRLVLSGGLMSNNVSEAEAMAKTALSLGIDPHKIDPGLSIERYRRPGAVNKTNCRKRSVHFSDIRFPHAALRSPGKKTGPESHPGPHRLQG